jgi:hypothetical protein
MRIQIASQDGAVLKTQHTYLSEDISIIPLLEDVGTIEPTAEE